MPNGLALHFSARDSYPPEHLGASRHDRRLQARHRDDVEEARRRHPSLECPDCGSAEHLAWFWFSSPPWTWEKLCGRAGVVAFCDLHERQIAYFLHAMN